MVVEYDVAVIGAGISGTCVVDSLKDSGMKVALFDNGGINSNRRVCDSVGKLGRSLLCGGFLAAPSKSNFSQKVGKGARKDICNDVLDTFSKYVDIKLPKRFFLNNSIRPDTASMLKKSNFDYTAEPFYYLGPEKCYKIAGDLYKDMESYNNVDVYFSSKVFTIERKNKKFELETSRGTVIAKKCVFAVGQSGVQWAKGQLQKFYPDIDDNLIRLGVRIEIPRSIVKSIYKDNQGIRLSMTNGIYSARTSYLYKDSKIIQEPLNDLVVTNAIQGPKASGIPTISVTIEQLVECGTDVAINAVEVMNVLADGKLSRERASAFLFKKSISKNIQELYYVKDVVQEFENISSGFSDNAWVYTPEISLCTIDFNIDNNFKLNDNDVYMVGEASGVTENLLEDAASGVVVARSIRDA